MRQWETWLVALLGCFISLQARADLLVSNFGSGIGDHVLRYNQQTGASLGTLIGGDHFDGSGLGIPAGMVVGPDGGLYVGDFYNRVWRYDRSSGTLTPFVTADSGGLQRAEGIVFGPDNNLYVSSSIGNSILRYNGLTGAYIDAFVPARSGGLNSPLGIVFGPDNNLYVGSFGNDKVLRYNGVTGAFIDEFVPSVNLNTGLAFGPDGNLYVSLHDGGVVRFNGSTGASLGLFAGGLTFSRGLAFGPDGNLYVGNGSNGSILQYNGTTGSFLSTFIASGSGGISSPGYLLFAEIPEPTTTALIGGLCAVALCMRRRGP